MATGGAGGFRLGEAYIYVGIQDKDLFKGLNRIDKALKGLGARLTASLSGLKTSGAVAKLNAVASSINRVTTAARNATTQVNRLNASLGRLRGNLSNSLNSYGSFIGKLIRAAGVAVGSAFRGVFGGIGSGTGSAARGIGAGISNILSGLGLGLKRVAQGFGSALSMSIRAAGGAMRGLGSLLGAALTPLKMLRGIGGLGAIGGGVAGGLGVAASANEAIKWESQMVRLQRITGAVGGRFARLQADIKGIASNMAGVSLDDVLELTAFGAKLGVVDNQLRLFTRDIARIKLTLEDIGIDDAATRIARLVQVFNRGNHEALNFASAIIKLDNISTASGREILDVASRLSGAFATFGGKPQQALALAAALREAAIPIETAGTSITQIIGRMASMRDMAQFARTAGMGTKEFRSTLQGDPLKALVAVEKGLQRISELKGPVEAARVLDKLHLDGQRVRNTMLQLAPVIDRLDTFLKASEKSFATGEDAISGYNKQAATTAAQWTRMVNNSRLLAAEMGHGLLPIIKGLATGIENLTRDLRAFFEANRAKFADFGKRIGEVASFTGLLVSNFRDVWRLVSLIAQEKWEQLKQVGANFAENLRKNLDWAFKNVPIMLGNVAMGVGRVIADLVSQLVTRIGQEIQNFKADLPGWLGGGGQKVPANKMQGIGVNPALFGNPMANVAPRPTLFGGLFANMPNRQAQIQAQMGVLRQQAADQRARGARRLAMDDLRDRFARGVAGFGQNVAPGLMNFLQQKGPLMRGHRRGRDVGLNRPEAVVGPPRPAVMHAQGLIAQARQREADAQALRARARGVAEDMRAEGERRRQAIVGGGGGSGIASPDFIARQGALRSMRERAQGVRQRANPFRENLRQQMDEYRANLRAQINFGRTGRVSERALQPRPREATLTPGEKAIVKAIDGAKTAIESLKRSGPFNPLGIFSKNRDRRADGFTGE